MENANQILTIIVACFAIAGGLIKAILVLTNIDKNIAILVQDGEHTKKQVESLKENVKELYLKDDDKEHRLSRIEGEHNRNHK